MGGSHETPFKMKGSAFYGLGSSSPTKDTKPHTGKDPDGKTHGPHGPKGATWREKLKAAGTAIWENIGATGEGTLSASEQISKTYKSEKLKSRRARGQTAPGPKGFSSEAQYKAYQSGDENWKDVS